MNEKKARPEGTDEELKARLDRLSSAIRTETTEAADARAGSDSSSSAQVTGKAMGLGFRVASELLAGVLVGGGIGWAIDRWLGSAPFGLIVMLLFGMAAGFWNVYRLAVRPTGPDRGQGGRT
ncbi:MAG: AtpZ/AtpI family protein [Beijerinckiaceae bacterium]